LKVSVIILTFNSESTIAATIESAVKISDDVHIVDSFSSDATLALAARYPVTVVQHAFENYGAQRNWASDNLPLKADWELHLDADEMVSPGLAERIGGLDEAAIGEVRGFYLPRLVRFMGKPIRHGGMYPIWHLRLFCRRQGRCENRQYDQHFYVDGLTARLPEPIIDDIRMSLTEWVHRHNRWSDAEVNELLARESAGRITPDWRGDAVQRKRFLRRIYEGFPLFVRPVLLFWYRYFFRLGFLDGFRGLVFFVLQTFWFRFLIDAKLYEKRLSRPA
jgi:glycosyltransferase involved in cell wall biosynthesis